MIDHYDWEGGREAMLRFGPSEGPVVVAALPLFEEANRTRTFVVTILRALAERGIATALPDLPGQGESIVRTEEATIFEMREAMAGAAAHASLQGQTYALGVRSGTLLDLLGMFHGYWHLAPLEGSDVLRELLRIAQAGGSLSRDVDVHALIEAKQQLSVGGNLISPNMVEDLQGAIFHEEPGHPRRIVRLESDPKPADLKVPGAPLWRRAEPDNDPALAELLADDIAAWVRACEG